MEGLPIITNTTNVITYYRNDSGGFLVSLSTGIGQTEISQEEYHRLHDIIVNYSVEAPKGYYYRLTSNEEWVLEKLPEPNTDPELTDRQILDALFGGN